MHTMPSRDESVPSGSGAPPEDGYAVAMVATAEELPLDYSVHIRVNRSVWDKWGKQLGRGPIGQRWGRSQALHEFMLRQVAENEAKRA